MDLSDIKTRKDFCKIINRMGYKIGVEVGVCQAINASWLLDNSSLEVLYGVENWSVRSCKRCRSAAEAKMLPYGDRFVWKVGNSTEEADKFKDNSIDFLYIDGDHRYKAVLADMQKWYPKVRAGGFFGGHDYVVARKCGVIPAVDEFFAKLGRNFLLTDKDFEDTNISFWIIK